MRLIDTGDNRGRGYARSTGVAAARGALIATVDADVILPPDWLTRARQALCGRDAVGGIAVPDGDVTYLRKRFGLAPRVVHGTTTVTGNNGLYRRGVFDVIGFDPALREGEDSALNHAMRRHGLSAATVPGLLVQHEGNKALAASLRWLFEVGQGATRQLLTYGEIRQPDIVTGAFVGSAALGLAVAARKHRLRRRGHTGRLRPRREHPARTQPVRDAARPAGAGGARGRRRQRDAHRLLRRAAGGPVRAAAPGAYPGGTTPAWRDARIVRRDAGLVRRRTGILRYCRPDRRAASVFSEKFQHEIPPGDAHGDRDRRGRCRFRDQPREILIGRLAAARRARLAPARPASYLGVYENGAPPDYAPVAGFAAAAGRAPNLVGYFSGWPQPFAAAFARQVRRRGGVITVQIDPTDALVADIARGEYDGYLRSYADSVRDFGHPVVIGFGHEMNARWYSWGYTHVPAVTFVGAWRHIVRLFRSQGADNVTWLWTSQRGPGQHRAARLVVARRGLRQLGRRRRLLLPSRGYVRHRLRAHAAPDPGTDQQTGPAIRDRRRPRGRAGRQDHGPFRGPGPGPDPRPDLVRQQAGRRRLPPGLAH